VIDDTRSLSYDHNRLQETPSDCTPEERTVAPAAPSEQADAALSTAPSTAPSTESDRPAADRSRAEVVISARNVTAGYENRRAKTRLIALRDVSLDVRKGEFLAIVGPSGCGKSTFVNMIAGFLKPLEGEMLVDGAQVAGPGADRAMVFQDYALLPWRTVESNVRFAMENRRSRPSKAEQADRVTEALGLVGLTGFEKSFPHELSGGMRQRVGIARALVTKPDVLLMDEPFGAVDAMTREAMQAEFEKIIAATRQTVIFITHSIDEAVMLGDRVAIVSNRPGRIREVVDIDLPRPRLEGDTKTSPRFAELREHIWSLLQDEALGAKEVNA
jgi:NitT/TauT family transport system ATP-binding protein